MAKQTVTFRLEEAEIEALAAEAQARGIKSFHERARQITLDYLADSTRIELEQQAARIEHLTEMVRKLAYTVMVNVSEIDNDDANDWIKKHMPREPD